MKLKIIQRNNKARIFLDDKELFGVKRYEIRYSVNDAPEALIEFYPHEVDYNSDDNESPPKSGANSRETRKTVKLHSEK